MDGQREEMESRAARLRDAGLAAEVVAGKEGLEVRVTMPWSDEPYNVRSAEDVALALSEAA